MSHTKIRWFSPFYLACLGCLLSGTIGCRSTGAKLATVPGFGWLSSEEQDDAAQLASSLPAPSSVTSPEPIRPQDEAIQTADASSSRLASASSLASRQPAAKNPVSSTGQYPATQYPAIQGAGSVSPSDASAVRAASATGRAAFGYETGPYDMKQSQAAGAVAPPEKLAGNEPLAAEAAATSSSVPAAQRGMYDADYKGPAESRPAAAAAQTTWASDAAASFEASADEEVPQTFQQQPAPPELPAEQPAAAPAQDPAGRTSAWEGGDTAAVAPAAEFVPVGFGYAAEAIGRVPAGDSQVSQHVTYEQPIESETKAASVYEAKAKQESNAWRPGSTTSYR